MTLEQALRQIKEQHNADLLAEKDRVIALLCDYLPGDRETKKIRNRTKWVYEQGAIRALAETPDHTLGRSKAINIMKSNTDLQETAIEETINAFCIAMGWNSAIPPKQQPQPAPVAVQQPKPAPVPQPKPIPVPQPRPAPVSQSMSAASSPCVSTMRTHSGYTTSAKTQLVHEIVDYIEGNKALDASVKRLAHRQRHSIKLIRNILLHLVVQILALLCIRMLVIGDVDGGKLFFFIFACYGFFLWESWGAGRNILIGCTTNTPGKILAVLLVIAATVAYFIIPMQLGFNTDEFWQYQQFLFWPVMALGNVGRIIRGILIGFR